MESRVKYMLLRTVQDKGILPVTSICNMACQFCSHNNNPLGLDVYRLGHLDMDLIEELIEYLPAEGPVIIGESATRIIEGDPMVHPDFKEIISRIRGIFPRKKINITTNGSNLDDMMIDFLEAVQSVELNISLNSSSPDSRAFLMADRKPAAVFKALDLLRESSLQFNGSLVAMPHLTGWSELDNSIKTLIDSKPETIRVFMPGFTRYSNENLKFDIESMYSKLRDLISGYSKSEVPVLLEPPLIEDFLCIVKGVIRDTPAYKAGIKNGDIIRSINQQVILSRVDGFNKLFSASNPLIFIYRDDEIIDFILEKDSMERSGIIVDYDLDPAEIDRLCNILINTDTERITLVTSVLAKGIMEAFIEYFYNKYPDSSNKKIDLTVAENNFFGGSIVSTGLLVNEDIIRSIKISAEDYGLIVLPGIIYDIFGNDLTGKNYKEIEKELDVEVVVVK